MEYCGGYVFGRGVNGKGMNFGKRFVRGFYSSNQGLFLKDSAFNGFPSKQGLFFQ